MCGWTCIYACGAQRATVSVFLNRCPSWFLKFYLSLCCMWVYLHICTCVRMCVCMQVYLRSTESNTIIFQLAFENYIIICTVCVCGFFTHVLFLGNLLSPLAVAWLTLVRSVGLHNCERRDHSVMVDSEQQAENSSQDDVFSPPCHSYTLWILRVQDPVHLTAQGSPVGGRCFTNL